MAGREATEYFFATGFSPLGAGHVNASSRGQNLGSRVTNGEGLWHLCDTHLICARISSSGCSSPSTPTSDTSATLAIPGGPNERNDTKGMRAFDARAESELACARQMNSLDRTPRLTAGRLALDTPADPRARHGVDRGGPNQRKSSGKNPKKRVKAGRLREGAFLGPLAGWTHF